MKPGQRDARRRVFEVDAEQQGQGGTGKLLTSVPDLHSHTIMGWAMALQMPATLVCTALANGVCKCRLVPRHFAASLAVRSGREVFGNMRGATVSKARWASVKTAGHRRVNACGETLPDLLKIERLHGKWFAFRRRPRTKPSRVFPGAAKRGCI